jgi:hypothetical protein
VFGSTGDESAAVNSVNHAEAVEESGAAAESRDSFRVRPEELALAAAALEARREDELKEAELSLPIDQAIHQLGLRFAPDELRAEVETLRARRLVGVRWRTIERVVGATIASAVAIAGIALLIAREMHGPRALAADPVSTVLPIERFSVVPGGMPVHVESATLGSLATAVKTPGDVYVDTRPTPRNLASKVGAFTNEWQLVKSGGRMEVEAFASADQALSAANGLQASVFSSRPPWIAADGIVPVRLPLYRFALDSESGLTADGRTGDSTTSIVQSATIPDSDTAIKCLVRAYVWSRDDGDGHDWQGFANRYDNIEFEARDGVIRLTGSVKTEQARNQAATHAAEALRRLGLTQRIDNRLKVDPGLG